MAEIIKFPKRFRPPPVKAERPAKKQRVRPWIDPWHTDHLCRPDPVHKPGASTIEIGKRTSGDARDAIAAVALKALLDCGAIRIGVGRPGPHQFAGGEWNYASDRRISRCLNQHLNFTKDGRPCRSPSWLGAAVGFAALHWKQQEVSK
jgi:hypothetical protein